MPIRDSSARARSGKLDGVGLSNCSNFDGTQSKPLNLPKITGSDTTRLLCSRLAAYLGFLQGAGMP